jgi:hypothetical protein
MEAMSTPVQFAAANIRGGIHPLSAVLDREIE